MEKIAIKYPKYTREQNLACKLNNKQILDIREKRKQGWRLKDLAKLYLVAPTTILYWVSEEHRKKVNADSLKWHKENDNKNERKKRDFNYKKRKRILFKEEMFKYDKTHRNKETDKNYHRLVWKFIQENKLLFDEFRKKAVNVGTNKQKPN